MWHNQLQDDNPTCKERSNGLVCHLSESHTGLHRDLAVNRYWMNYEEPLNPTPSCGVARLMLWFVAAVVIGLVFLAVKR